MVRRVDALLVEQFSAEPLRLSLREFIHVAKGDGLAYSALGRIFEIAEMPLPSLTHYCACLTGTFRHGGRPFRFGGLSGPIVPRPSSRDAPSGDVPTPCNTLDLCPYPHTRQRKLGIGSRREQNRP